MAKPASNVRFNPAKILSRRVFKNGSFSLIPRKRGEVHGRINAKPSTTGRAYAASRRVVDTSSTTVVAGHECDDGIDVIVLVTVLVDITDVCSTV